MDDFYFWGRHFFMLGVLYLILKLVNLFILNLMSAIHSFQYAKATGRFLPYDEFYENEEPERKFPPGS